MLNYKDYYEELKGCEKTAEFCQFINKMFDALNRTKPENGLKLDSRDYMVRKPLIFLDFLIFHYFSTIIN